jgi:hypothetical protein
VKPTVAMRSRRRAERVSVKTKHFLALFRKRRSSASYSSEC